MIRAHDRRAKRYLSPGRYTTSWMLTPDTRIQTHVDSHGVRPALTLTECGMCRVAPTWTYEYGVQLLDTCAILQLRPPCEDFMCWGTCVRIRLRYNRSRCVRIVCTIVCIISFRHGGRLVVMPGRYDSGQLHPHILPPVYSEGCRAL